MTDILLIGRVKLCLLGGVRATCVGNCLLFLSLATLVADFVVSRVGPPILVFILKLSLTIHNLRIVHVGHPCSQCWQGCLVCKSTFPPFQSIRKL